MNSAFKILNDILVAERISAQDGYADATTLIIGSTPYHLLPTCFQVINEDQSIDSMDLGDFSNMDFSACVAQLNLLNIKLPMSKDRLDDLMDFKFTGQNIPAKSVQSEDIWRYVDKIQVIALFNDVLRPQKEFPMSRIIHVLDQVMSAVDLSDMSN